MRNLYTKAKVHPSPPATVDRLSFLPAKILTLTVALSPQDREVLAYLISCSGPTTNYSSHRKTTSHGGGDHAPPFNCNSITCSGSSNNFSGHRETAPNGGAGGGGGDHAPLFNCNCFGCYMSYWVRWDTSPNRQLIHEILDAYEERLFLKKTKKERKKRVCHVAGELNQLSRDSAELDSVEVSSEVNYGDDGEVGSVRKIVRFIGERIWGVWGL